MTRGTPRISAALLCAFACACAEQARTPRFETEVTLPEDALADDPAVGLTEPRVTVTAPVASPLGVQLPPPSFSASARFGTSPASLRSVSDVREVTLEIDFVGLSRKSLLSLELLTPSGEAYEAREVSVGGDPYATYKAQFIVPVAGTAIDRSNLSGVWTASYFLAGHALTTTTFELEP